jgi:hypothetical protein
MQYSKPPGGLYQTCDRPKRISHLADIRASLSAGRTPAQWGHAAKHPHKLRPVRCGVGSGDARGICRRTSSDRRVSKRSIGLAWWAGGLVGDRSVRRALCRRKKSNLFQIREALPVCTASGVVPPQSSRKQTPGVCCAAADFLWPPRNAGRDRVASV